MILVSSTFQASRAEPTWIRPWLLLAAIYNATWGSAMVIAPKRILAALGVNAQSTTPWRAIGLMVLAYAPAYAWAARRLELARLVVTIAVLGKVGGIVGFLGARQTGNLPTRFGLTILTNDAIWLIPFVGFLLVPHGGILLGRSRRGSTSAEGTS